MNNYKIPEILKLIRPQQWIKNLFLLIPLFFAGNFFDYNALYKCVLGIMAFSAIASSIYILNDIKDVKADQKHPGKKYRPLASGKIKQSTAYLLMVVLIVIGTTLSLLLEVNFTIILGIYFILNIGYCFGLKHVSIVDMLIVATGFVLRTLAGGVITHIILSKWLLMMIFLLALFLALAKRRDDILVFLKDGISVRESSSTYNLDFINSALTIISTTIIISYLMYTISDQAFEHIGFEHLYITTIFVISGILRYLQITLVENNSSSPVRVLYTDRFIQTTIILWVISYFIILYIYN